MSSYLAQFNYQFIRGGGKASSAEDFRNPQLRKFVFLHGLMGYGLNWRRIAAGMGPQDVSLIFDQRGHGRSWKPLTGYAPEDFAEDLEIIRQELDWERFYLIGHSMGGRNAMAYAYRFPQRLIKLVVEDIGPESRPEDVDYYQNLLGSIPTPFATKLQAKEFFLNEFPKLKIRSSNPQTLGSYLYSNIVETPNGQADWRFAKDAILRTVSEGRAKDYWHELRALTVPTLIIRGANSTELSAETYRRMLVANPHIQGVEIPDAGHWVHSDQPEALLRVLRDFVADASVTA